MNSKLNRRRFIARSALASAGVTVVGSSTSTTDAKAAPGAVTVSSRLPTGRIGKLTVSRLISGGNLISGWAHSRDLHYVPALMRAYNTDEKVLDTLERLEEHGINTIIADPRKKPMEVLARYWKERGGKMQWIAEGHPGVDDWRTNIRESIDFGAAAVYVQGVIGDRWLKEGRMELLGQCVQFIQARGVPGGIGAHQIGVIVEAERQKLGADFYVKTLHHGQYWSKRRPDQSLDVIDNPADNYWEMDPEKTIGFMVEVEKPWIAFKVLAAGAIRPESGFKFALENGADFLCVGMFDFQVESNAALMRRLLASSEIENRPRPWMA